MIILNDKLTLTEDTVHLLTELASQEDCTEFEIIEAIIEDWAFNKLNNLEED